MKKDQSYSNDSIIYKKQCSILNMTAVPYLGVYSQNYTFMHPTSVLQSTLNSDHLHSLPEKMRESIGELQKSVSLQKPDFFTVHLDGSFLHDKYIKTHSDEFLRINLVLHPYIFQDLNQINQSKDHKINIIPSLYRTDKDDPIYASSGDEMILIDNTKIYSKNNIQEVILHSSDDGTPAISPNNCTFLISISQNIMSFYTMCLIYYKVLNTNCLIGNLLTRGLSTLNPDNISKKEIKQIKQDKEDIDSKDIVNLDTKEIITINDYKDNIVLSNFLVELNKTIVSIQTVIKSSFGLFLALIKKHPFESRKDARVIIESIFQVIFASTNLNDIKLNQNMKEESNIDLQTKHSGKCYCDYLFQFIQLNLSYLEINNLGEEFFFETYNSSNNEVEKDSKHSRTLDYQIEIQMKYQRQILRRFDDIYKAYYRFIKSSLGVNNISDEVKPTVENINSLNKGTFDELNIQISNVMIDVLNKNGLQNLFEKTFENLKKEDLFIFGLKNIENFNTKISNPSLHLLQGAMEETFNDNMDGVYFKIMSLEKCMQSILFFRTWEVHDRILGVHSDFGRHAFFNSDMIGSNYHSNKEEIIELMLYMVALIEGLDAM